MYSTRNLYSALSPYALSTLTLITLKFSFQDFHVSHSAGSRLSLSNLTFSTLTSHIQHSHFSISALSHFSLTTFTARIQYSRISYSTLWPLTFNYTLESYSQHFYIPQSAFSHLTFSTLRSCLKSVHRCGAYHLSASLCSNRPRIISPLRYFAASSKMATSVKVERKWKP